MSEVDSEDRKFVVVLSKKLEVGVALNAASHMVAALMEKANTAEREQMKFMNYIDGSSEEHLVSGLSLIVLRAENSNKIRQARGLAIASAILHVDFTESMTGGTYIEQMERTKSLSESELNYYGLCMFGNKQAIDEITSKFSLWR